LLHLLTDFVKKLLLTVQALSAAAARLTVPTLPTCHPTPARHLILLSACIRLKLGTKMPATTVKPARLCICTAVFSLDMGTHAGTGTHTTQLASVIFMVELALVGFKGCSSVVNNNSAISKKHK
jgi:hypothetical protein